jgi:hypothetical protein
MKREIKIKRLPQAEKRSLSENYSQADPDHPS